VKKNSVLIILAVLAGLNLLAWVAVFELAGTGELEVVFFDVGQGDAAFIELPNRQQILIDGGPDGQLLLEKLGKEMPFWDRTIDLVILTHPEHDHMAGLLEVLKRYKIENILWTGVLRDTAEYKEWERLIKKEEANVFIARDGQTIDGGGAFINILHPFEILEGKTVTNTNNTSVAVRLVFGETSFLFTGDAYKSVERELINGGAEIDSDVLKAGHHGSKTSTAPEFVESVSPEIVVISCGKDNPYGHPNPETLQALEGIDIFRTDFDGDIKIISDGAIVRGESSNN
jgi:competence protein ComEC